MKKHFNAICVLFFGILFALMAFGVNAQTVNLVPNPSLETSSGNTPLNWLTGNWGTNTTTFTYLTTGHTGTRSVMLQMTAYTSGDAKWYYTPQTVTAGKTYSVSDWYESNITSHVIVQFTLANGTNQYTELATAPASATTWKQYTATVIAPANTASMTVFHLISAVGWLTTDDYSLVAVSAPATGSITVTKVAVNGNGTFNFTGSTGISAFAITTTSGAGSYTINNLNPGVYTVTEGTSGSGWTQTATTCGSVTVAAGNTAICTITNTYTVPAGYNFVPNPSIETASGGSPINWNSDNWGNNSASFAYQATGHTGNHSLKVQITSYTDGDAKWYFDPITVAPGDVYLFSDWYQSNLTSRVVIDFTNTDGTDNYGEIRNVPPSSGWAQYSDIIWVPSNVKSMTVFHLISNAGWLVTDDYSLTKTTLSGFSRPVMSLTFDDGDETIYKNAFPILAGDGFKSTAYIISNTLTDTSGAYISPAQLKTMSAAGFEIGSHSVSHPDLTTLTASQLNTELAQSKKDLEGVVGAGNVKSFASPYGAYNTAVLNAIKANYQSHRPVDVGYNVKNNFDAYRLKVQNMASTTTMAEYQSWINQAIKDRSWLVIAYHKIVSSSPGDYDTLMADFTQQMAYIKSTGITVEPVSTAVAEVGAQ